jgi:hypothetical protein
LLTKKKLPTADRDGIRDEFEGRVVFGAWSYEIVDAGDEYDLWDSGRSASFIDRVKAATDTA